MESILKTVIYHNPRCSKSRQALNILKESGIDAEVVEYLKTPLSEAQLEKLYKQLGGEGRNMIRTKELEFKQLQVDLDNPQDLVTAIAKLPKLMERPIVVRGDRAVIGRPPEAVLSLIGT